MNIDISKFIKMLYELSYKNKIKWNVIENYTVPATINDNPMTYTFTTKFTTSAIFNNTRYEITIKSFNNLIEIKENGNFHIIRCNMDAYDYLYKLQELLIKQTIESEEIMISNIMKGM